MVNHALKKEIFENGKCKRQITSIFKHLLYSPFMYRILFIQRNRFSRLTAHTFKHTTKTHINTFCISWGIAAYYFIYVYIRINLFIHSTPVSQLTREWWYLFENLIHYPTKYFMLHAGAIKWLKIVYFNICWFVETLIFSILIFFVTPD